MQSAQGDGLGRSYEGKIGQKYVTPSFWILIFLFEAKTSNLEAAQLPQNEK